MQRAHSVAKRRGLPQRLREKQFVAEPRQLARPAHAKAARLADRDLPSGCSAKLHNRMPRPGAGAGRTSKTSSAERTSPWVMNLPSKILTHQPKPINSAYGSKYLSAADVGTRKIRTKILKVRKQELRGKDDTKRMRFVLFLKSLDKPMVLNATNKDALVSALGKTPASWSGAAIGLFVDPDVKFGQSRTGGLRLRVLLPPAAAKPVAKPAPAPAAAGGCGHRRRAGRKGDPGPDWARATSDPANDDRHAPAAQMLPGFFEGNDIDRRRRI